MNPASLTRGELVKIVCQLAQTADGVPITPSVKVWVNMKEHEQPQFLGSGEASGQFFLWCSRQFPLSDCYSTRKAALAAKVSP